MAKRPFISLGIVKLEALFESKRGNRDFLGKLLHELSHRSTRRAKRLEERAKLAHQKSRISSLADQRAAADKPPTSDVKLDLTGTDPLEETPVADDGATRSEPKTSEESAQIPSAEAWTPRERPPVRNDPAKILSSWIAHEVLSPNAYKKPQNLVGDDSNRVYDFSNKTLPWAGGGEKARPRTRLYYHVVLGSISMAEANKSLLEVYADTRPEPPSFKGSRSAIAIVTVDQGGRPAEDTGVVISSFAWGFGVARAGDLRRLSAWPEQERDLVDALRRHLVHRDEDDRILPLTMEQIDSASSWLRRTLALNENEVEPARYALRVYQWYGLREDPDPPLLNSFGMPLLVHRRCDNPMFAISNQVAYGNLMVKATGERRSPLRDLFGPSRWITVEGLATDKWCPAEGEIVVDLFRKIAMAGIKGPDIYVISPFRIVGERMRQRLRKESALIATLTEEPYKWLHEHVGNVHVFQGKEADVVVFLLGAPLPRQNGARSWAGRRPNLLNVSVTRAKCALYVIGRRELWRLHGYFQTLNRFLD